jgi:predicted amidohydrolase
MILAAAQTIPKQGNIKENMDDHRRLIELAAENKVQLIVFPELSLTGYERELASNLAFSIQDKRLSSLRKISAEKNIIIIAGAPIKMATGLHIGAFAMFPDNSVKIYTKQFLHKGEEDYYEPNFDYNPMIKLEDESISLAICADIENPAHVDNAARTNSTIYLASIFYTTDSIKKVHKLLRNYSKKYSMNVFMSNFGGKSWRLESGGQSAFWENTGKLIIKYDGTGEGLIVVQKVNNVWSGDITK